MAVPYEYCAFPARVYHRDYHTTGQSTLVHDEDELREALASGAFVQSPADCPAQPPATTPDAGEEDREEASGGDAKIDGGPSPVVASPKRTRRKT